MDPNGMLAMLALILETNHVTMFVCGLDNAHFEQG